MEENKLEVLLQNEMQARYEHYDRITQLLEQSEKRIDRTNEMISKLCDVVEHNHQVLEQICNEYCKRIDKLADNRDVILEQNKMLTKIIESISSKPNINVK